MAYPSRSNGRQGGATGASPPPSLNKQAEAPSDTLKGFVQRFFVGLVILAIAYIMYAGIHVLLEAFAGLLFAVFLSALSGWLSQRTGMRYGWALTAVVIALIVLTLGIGWLLANRLSAQLSEMVQVLPKSLEQFRGYLSQYGWGKLLLENMPKSNEVSLAQLGRFTQSTGLISGVGTFLEAGIVILIVGIFGAAEPEVYKQGLLHVVPFLHRPRVRDAIDAVAFNLRWWLLGQICLMIILWVTTTLGLWAIGVPLALTLGLITGIFELIPYLGDWLAAVPSLLIALLHGPWYALMAGALYLFLHLMEGYVLLPLIQRRAVELPPALTLVAQVLLGELLGILGLFVAAPLTVTVIILFKMLYIEDALGDQAIDVPGEPGNASKPPEPRVSETGGQ